MTDWYDKNDPSLATQRKRGTHPVPPRRNYACSVRMLSQSYGKTPDQISEQVLQDYFPHLLPVCQTREPSVKDYGPRCPGVHPPFPAARSAHRLHEDPLLRFPEPQVAPVPLRKSLYPHPDGLCLRLGDARLSRKAASVPHLSKLRRHPPIPHLFFSVSSTSNKPGQLLKTIGSGPKPLY